MDRQRMQDYLGHVAAYRASGQKAEVRHFKRPIASLEP